MQTSSFCLSSKQTAYYTDNNDNFLLIEYLNCTTSSYSYIYLWSLLPKHRYRPKPEFNRRGFLKFDRLVLAPNVFIGSNNWLVCLSYNQESIPKVVYFFEFFCAWKWKKYSVWPCFSSMFEYCHRNMVIVQKQIIYLLFHLDTSRLIF